MSKFLDRIWAYTCRMNKRQYLFFNLNEPPTASYKQWMTVEEHEYILKTGEQPVFEKSGGALFPKIETGSVNYTQAQVDEIVKSSIEETLENFISKDDHYKIIEHLKVQFEMKKELVFK